MILKLFTVLGILFFPEINFNNINVSPDFMILLILFSLKDFSVPIIIIGSFSIGFLKDSLTQVNLFGVNTFLLGVLGYLFLVSMSIKNNVIKYFSIFLFIFLYHFCFFYITISDNFLFIITLSVLKTFSTYIVFLLFIKNKS